jgi:bifunctional DNA-binding transcriptional regulator/antitoxin component of YhaV-PrlF toxin-antitoxin module
MNYIPVNIAKNGRLVLPIQARRAIGLEEGGQAGLSFSEKGVELRSMREIRNKIRQEVTAAWSGKGSAVDALFAMRREDAAQEDAEFAAYQKSAK